MIRILTGLVDSYVPVTLEFDEIFIEIICQSGVRDVPQLHCAVLGGGGNDVVVERIPFDVENGTAVPGNL